MEQPSDLAGLALLGREGRGWHEAVFCSLVSSGQAWHPFSLEVCAPAALLSRGLQDTQRGVLHFGESSAYLLYKQISQHGICCGSVPVWCEGRGKGKQSQQPGSGAV